MAAKKKARKKAATKPRVRQVKVKAKTQPEPTIPNIWRHSIPEEEASSRLSEAWQHLALMRLHEPTDVALRSLAGLTLAFAPLEAVSDDHPLKRHLDILALVLRSSTVNIKHRGTMILYALIYSKLCSYTSVMAECLRDASAAKELMRHVGGYARIFSVEALRATGMAEEDVKLPPPQKT